VKIVRVWLVVLLVLLLPVRGAVAAGMLCEAEAQHGGSALALQAAAAHGHDHDHALAHAHGHGHEHAQHHAEAGHEAAGHGVAAGGDACSLCAGCCSAAGMVSTLPTVAVADVARAIHFPCLSADAPSFIAAGLERPPRSI